MEKDIALMTFEEALAELEAIISRIDGGQEPLEEAVNSFERAILLKRHCQEKLQSAKLKLEKVMNTPERQLQPLEE